MEWINQKIITFDTSGWYLSHAKEFLLLYYQFWISVSAISGSSVRCERIGMETNWICCLLRYVQCLSFYYAHNYVLIEVCQKGNKAFCEVLVSIIVGLVWENVCWIGKQLNKHDIRRAVSLVFRIFSLV